MRHKNRRAGPTVFRDAEVVAALALHMLQHCFMRWFPPDSSRILVVQPHTRSRAYRTVLMLSTFALLLTGVVEGMELSTLIGYLGMLASVGRVLPVKGASRTVDGMALINDHVWWSELKRALLMSGICVQVGVCLILASTLATSGLFVQVGVGALFAAFLIPFGALALLAKAMSDRSTFEFPVSKLVAFFVA